MADNSLGSFFDKLFKAIEGPVAAAKGITDVGSTIALVWKSLSDGKMWRSMGWILLGWILVIVGILVMFRKPISNTITTAGKAAELAAL